MRPASRNPVQTTGKYLFDLSDKFQQFRRIGLIHRSDELRLPLGVGYVEIRHDAISFSVWNYLPRQIILGIVPLARHPEELREDSQSDANYFFWAASLAATSSGLFAVADQCCGLLRW